MIFTKFTKFNESWQMINRRSYSEYTPNWQPKSFPAQIVNIKYSFITFVFLHW